MSAGAKGLGAKLGFCLFGRVRFFQFVFGPFGIAPFDKAQGFQQDFQQGFGYVALRMTKGDDQYDRFCGV